MTHRRRYSIRFLLLSMFVAAFFMAVVLHKYREESSREALGAYLSDDYLTQDLLDRALGLEGHTQNLEIGMRTKQAEVDLRLLKNFPQLKKVSLHNSDRLLFSNEMRFENVEELSLWYCNCDVIKETIRFFPNIETLNIWNTHGEGSTFGNDLDLTSIRNCNRLKQIHIEHDGITGAFLDFVPGSNLASVRLKSNSIRYDILEYLVRFENLTHLELWNSGDHENEIDLKDFAQLTKLKDVRFEFFRNEICPSTAHQLFKRRELQMVNESSSPIWRLSRFRLWTLPLIPFLIAAYFAMEAPTKTMEVQ